jgi:hypothetical protein
MDKTKGTIGDSDNPTGLIDIVTGVAIGDPQGPGFCNLSEFLGRALSREL